MERLHEEIDEEKDHGNDDVPDIELFRYYCSTTKAALKLL